MLIYEVNLKVDRAIESEYLAWLNDHVREMLELGCFEGAQIYREEQDGSGDGQFRMVVHYQVRGRETLQRYFDEHAASMRADGLERFGARFSATRRVLEPAR